MAEGIDGAAANDVDVVASRKAEEDSLRRNEAAGWLRKIVGVSTARDLGENPSEEQFRLALRSGIILCNALNRIQPAAVPKVVEAPCDSVIVPDGAALSAFQYFENVRNFLDSAEEMGIPIFEASDLEQGGKSSRIVNCVLALKSYHDWKQGGGRGVWKYSGNWRSYSATKQFFRKSSDPFVNSLSRTTSSTANTNSFDGGDLDIDYEMATSDDALHLFVRQLLSDRKQEDIPLIVGTMLGKVMEEFELRLSTQNCQAGTSSSFNEHQVLEVGTGLRGIDVPTSCCSSEVISASRNMDDPSYEKVVDTENPNIREDGSLSDNDFRRRQASKRKHLIQHYERSIQELRSTLHSTKEDLHLLHSKYQEGIQYLGKHLNYLANAASRYQKVLEENRKLYNQVQDLKGNIRVYCRIRPFLGEHPGSFSTAEALDDQTISVITPAKGGKGRKLFTFNKVFSSSSTQEEVFADTEPLIRSVLDGYNVCIFAYGQTGSGKTYTMTGPKELTQESLGVNYRALKDLFLITEQRKDSIFYDVSVQMIEIYNEQVRDLLVTDGVNRRLEISNSSRYGTILPDANILPVSSTTDVIELMNLGLKNRAVGSTSMNDRSSRSHSCFTVHVEGRNVTSGSIISGCMHLVDLAGSERGDKTDAVGERLKEAQHINRSLSVLGDVIAALAQKQSHIPYRNSKLTQLLQYSLGGQAKTLMFIHISPEADDLAETMSTLKFAERVSTVELGPSRPNKDGADVRELKEQIASLKAALLRKEKGESCFQSPDRGGLSLSGSFTSSPAPSWQSNGDGQTESSTVSRMQSFDTRDFMDSPLSAVSMEEDKSVSSDWVDKVMVKIGDDGSQSPQTASHHKNNRHDTSMVYPEQSLTNKITALRQKRLENGGEATNAAADDSEEVEIEASNSWELDQQSQINSSAKVNGGAGGTKARKHTIPQNQRQQQQLKSPETRSLIPQPPTRRVSNGPNSPSHKHGKKASTADVKRKPASTGGK